MKNYHIGFFRPATTPFNIHFFGVRSCGHFRKNISWKDNIPARHFVQVFWCVEGQGEFILQNEKIIVSRDEVFVYFPGMPHVMRSVTPVWDLYWWTMDGEYVTQMVLSLGLKPGRHQAGPFPLELYQKIVNNIQEHTFQAERTNCAAAITLLSRIPVKEKNEVENPLVQTALHIIHRYWRKPNFDINQLVEHLGVHRTTLNQQFKKETNHTPGAYLQELRTKTALSLLKENSFLTVAEITYNCGFRDPNYFSRLVRKVTGYSPRQYRELKVLP